MSKLSFHFELLCVLVPVCLCRLPLHTVWAGSQKVLRALLSPLEHARCLLSSVLTADKR